MKKGVELIKRPRLILFSWGMKGHFRFLNDVHYIKLMYWCKFGKALDLTNPLTFDQKIQWLKLHDRNPLYSILVDKYEVKKYVEQKIGKKYLIPTLGVWNNFDEIDLDKLPDKFVLKCTHDSGGIYICRNKNSINWSEAKHIIESSLRRNYFWVGREWPYKDVKPRIIAEPLLVDESGAELKDYKVFNFNGNPKLIQVDYDRFVHHRRNLYNTNWEYVSAEIKYPTDASVQIPKPKCLDEMLFLASILSDGFIHVRTDFYIIKENIYFGELTFLHGSGYETFRPEVFGLEMGSWMNLKLLKGGS